jgi:two-component system sensor histidine kinase YesM
MVVAMAKLLRYTIDSEHEDSTVGAELQHADHYLRLQSNRFADALTYEIKLEERVAFKHALRLLVQPLVENAVKHGFRHRRQRMHIIVSAGLMHDSAINITVEDDGTGMSPARLEELRRKLEDDMMNTDGIGLLNVQRRIRLRFGAAYGMTIDSTEEIGTRVTLRLPAEFSEPGGEIN